VKTKSHEQAFVIIDRDFRIVAVNRAYERAHGSRRDKMVGQHCYQIGHKNDKPCFELGEDCPHQQVYQTGQGCSCQHTHYDTGGRTHRVRINAYLLQDSAGELYLGETVQDLSESAERSKCYKVKPVPAKISPRTLSTGIPAVAINRF
jgi:PAS domain S-box-containing protein